ncbi:polymer-forming cytoskeletal protein [Polynucleobacter sp. MWH-Svant-W18]|uniref:bactofilin family protein n=1 Tax=Polynucleobacter sp. MWH-Svant-W18 TaxID=1855909 RepID=UPI001BFEB52C|nr:polymer-forming cytoskeletal protein [Polynucleobacter sp. MWH-Svant-W18]QWD77744.1 polymer-forming cytoskeletal protein [Polynucleobacter sp. MWH-Svant-W18]
MMFKKTKKKALGKSIQDFESILGASIRVDGNLIIAKSVRIDGNLYGNILQEEGSEATIAIAPSACIFGDIRAEHIIVAGSVKGNIFSSGKIELLAHAHIEGDITYGNIGIEIGANVTGKLLQISVAGVADEAELLLSQMKQKIPS